MDDKGKTVDLLATEYQRCRARAPWKETSMVLKYTKDADYFPRLRGPAEPRFATADF